MLTAIIPPADRTALWAAFPNLPITWSAVPAAGITLPNGLRLSHSDAPDGEIPHLKITLYTSEPLEALLDGRGPYSQEELDDPYALIDQYWTDARDLMTSIVTEVEQTLGAPDVPGGPDWSRNDRTLSIGLTQADKEEPIEVCAWILPPGLTADHLQF